MGKGGTTPAKRLQRKLRLRPGIDHVDTAVLEIRNVMRSEFGPAHQRNRSNLRVCMADRPTNRPPMRGNSREAPSRIAFEAQDTTLEIFRKHCIRCRQQFLATLVSREKLKPIKNLRFGDGCSKELCRRLLSNPADHARAGTWSHQLRQNVCIENDHSEKSEMGRTGWREGS